MSMPKTIKDIEAKYKDKATIDAYQNDKTGVLDLSRVVVNDDMRKQGIGSEIMNDLVDYSDANGLRLELTPDTSFGGTSTSRLKKFYKQFGLLENKGRNKDFTISNLMYREPKRR